MDIFWNLTFYIFVATSLRRREIATMSSNVQVREWSNLRSVFGTCIDFIITFKKAKINFGQQLISFVRAKCFVFVLDALRR